MAPRAGCHCPNKKKKKKTDKEVKINEASNKEPQIEKRKYEGEKNMRKK
jgi:hypothetical protein